MSRMMEQIDRVAPQETSILLRGETGTGKSRLARVIHQISPRRAERFLVVNCGALSTTLIESEMFGHVKGSFTGADADRTGKFAEVGRGTLLLDDIDALPVQLQAKLLRVVEERVFEPVGSNRTLPMQARLIVASNCAFEREVAAARFRADLYYRLNVVSFDLLPLREQRELIPALAKRFLIEFTSRNGRVLNRIAPEALAALTEYHWPGNIRELRNVMERACALSAGMQIQLADLTEALRPADVRDGVLPGEGMPRLALSPLTGTLAQARDKTEVALIVNALERHQNNRLRAAAELGISRVTLYKKLRQYGLHVKKAKAAPTVGK
jgi:DNA-binding NtrC family response regulator